jgi:hypothetical protein
MHAHLPRNAPRRAGETEQKSGQNPVHDRALAAVQERAREVIEGALATLLFAAVAFQARLGVVGAPGTQGDRILSCSGEHHQQVVLVETT